MASSNATNGRIETADILKAAAALGVVGGSTQAARRLLALLCSPDATAAEIAAAIDREPGLAARVLRVANSAYYGLTRKVATLDRALMLLGLNAVKGIAAAACLDRSVPPGPTAARFDTAGMLRHCLAVATAAQSLARICRPALVSEAFVAGLLHDYGVLVQLRVDADGFTQLAARLLAEPDLSSSAVESASVSVGHELCTAVVFEEWNLPAPLVAAARHHHHPAEAPAGDQALVALVHVGDHVARETGFGFTSETQVPELDRNMVDVLGLSADDLAGIRDALAEQVQVLEQSLQGG